MARLRAAAFEGSSTNPRAGSLPRPSTRDGIELLHRSRCGCPGLTRQHFPRICHQRAPDAGSRRSFRMDGGGRHAAKSGTYPSWRQAIAAKTSHPVVVADHCGHCESDPSRGRNSAYRCDALGGFLLTACASTWSLELRFFASSHPSSMSVEWTTGAERAFRGSDPFGEVNLWFKNRLAEPIDWTIGD